MVFLYGAGWYLFGYVGGQSGDSGSWSVAGVIDHVQLSYVVAGTCPRNSKSLIVADGRTESSYC